MALGIRGRLVGRFRELSVERLNSLRRGFAELRARPLDSELGISVKREVHTVKGEARIAGFKVISQIAHEIENLLDGAGRGALTIPRVQAILSGIELIAYLAALDPEISDAEEAVVSWRAGAQEAMEGLPQGSVPLEEPAAMPAAASARPTLRVQLQRLASVSATATDVGAQIERNGATLAEIHEVFQQWRGELQRIRPLVARLEKADDLDPAVMVEAIGDLVAHLASEAQLGETIDAALGRATGEGLELSTASATLQDRVRELRFVPLSSTFERFPVAVKDIADELGKAVDLELVGGEIELDKRVIDRVGEPLLHLVCNAVDHGIEFPEDRIRSGKPVRGQIRLSAVEKDGRIQVVVHDDGRGIDATEIRAALVWRGDVAAEEAMEMTADALLDRIFDPELSTRTDLTTLSGRGVGLAVVRDTVEQLGGEVMVQTALGESTAFTLDLPMTAKESQPAREPSQLERSLDPGGESGSKRGRILVVDDSQFTLELVVDVFEKMGFEVIQAEDGERGLDRFRACPPDLIFTDLDMPVMDGFGLIREVRGSGSKVPIVVFTTRGTAEDRDRAMALGADLFLVKTGYRERQLHNIVAQYLPSDHST